MIENPDDLYDGGPKPKAPLPKPSSSEGYLNWRSTAAPSMQRVGLSFKVDGVTKPDQGKLFGDTGIFDPALSGQSISIEAGNRQSFGNKLTRRAANLIPNITASLIDMVGSAGSLLTEWGDERDYHNVLNEIADSMKNPAGENYRRSNDTWAFSDPTWWIDNIANLTEMGIGFGLGGWGAASTIGKIANSVTGLANLTAKGSKFMAAASELGTSALLSYAESAMDGATVYNSTYENQLTKFISQGIAPDEAKEKAKHIAAQSAATTAQLGTLLTMGLNAGAFAPYFKSAQNEALDIVAKRIAQAESRNGIGSSIRGLNAADYMDKLIHHNGIKQRLGEMVKEGGEEVLQQFAQQTGTDIGNEGKTKDFFNQFGELEHLLDRTANSQGLLSFALGAAFGGIQNVLVHDVFPSKRIDKISPDGIPIPKETKSGDLVLRDGLPVMQKTWITPRKHEYDFTKRRFDNLKESVAADFDNFDKASNDILSAVKSGDSMAADEARDRLFDSGKIHAVKSGLTSPWVKTFESIANTTPEKAKQLGYGEDYKQRAEQSITDIKYLNKVYSDISNKYDLPNNGHLVPYVDMVFARHADLYSTDKRIKEYKHKVEEDEAKDFKAAQVYNPVEFNEQLNKYTLQHNSAIEVERQLLEDHKNLMSGDAKVIARLLNKYRAVGYGDGDIATSIKDLDIKLRNKQEEQSNKVKQAEDSMLNSTNYITWLEKNPNKSFDDFLKEANENYNSSVQNRFRRAQLDAAEITQNIAKENLADMTKDKGLRKFTTKIDEWMKSMRDQAKAQEEAKIIQLSNETKDKTTVDRLQKIKQNRIAEGYRKERDVLLQNIFDNNQLIDKKKSELNNIKGFDIVRTSGLKNQIKRLQENNKRLNNRAKTLDTLFIETQTDTTPEFDPKEIEDVTGEQDGKVIESANEEPTTIPITIPSPIFIPPVEPIIGIPEQITIPIDLDINVPDPTEYEDLYKGITSHPKVTTKMEVIINGMFDGSIGFSLDHLKEEVLKKYITQDKANKLLLRAKEYVDDVQETYNLLNEQIDADELPPVQEPEIIQISGIDNPSTPVITNADPVDMADIPKNDAYHAGYKIINAASTGATSTIAYSEGTRINDKGETVYFKIAKPNEINPNLNEDILHPDKLLPGTKLIYEVDIDYDGEKNITDSLNWDDDGNVIKEREKGINYLDENGKALTNPNMIGNIPIRVIDAITGKYLFHIRKLDWLQAKFPNTDDYRNIVETLYTKDGEEIDNLGMQTVELLNFRTRIIEKFNKEGKPMEGKTTGKGTGRLILNNEVTKTIKVGLEPNTSMSSKIIEKFAINKSKPEESMLPDGSLELVIVDAEGTLYSNRNYEFEGVLGFDPKKSNMIKGGVGAMVPAANGQYLYAPLTGVRIVDGDKPSLGLNSIARAIELFLLNDGTVDTIGAEINNIQSNTGFNISTPKGLKAFINQYYTYSQRFEDSKLLPNGEAQEERFLFHIEDENQSILDKTRMIKAGWVGRGDGAQYANLINGTLAPAFINMLRDGLSTRSRAVIYTDQTQGLKGINSKNSFRDAVFIPSKGWKYNEFNNYNEYVKSFSKTAVYGRNQLSDGTYVYTANPQLPIDTSGSTLSGDFLIDENQSAQTVTLPVDNKEKTGANMLDDLFNMALQPQSRIVKEMGTASNNSKPLTVQTLQEIYNFTTEEQRNGKTVLEVYGDLASRGHSYLSDGYNPFSRCL